LRAHKQAGVSYGPPMGTMEFLGAHVSWVWGTSRLDQSSPQSAAWLRCGLRGASRAVQSCTTASPLRAACTPPRWSTPSKKRKRPETGHQGPPGRAIAFQCVGKWGGATPVAPCALSSHWCPHVLVQDYCKATSKQKLYFVCFYDAVAYLRQRRPVRQFASLGRSRPSSRPEASS